MADAAEGRSRTLIGWAARLHGALASRRATLVALLYLTLLLLYATLGVPQLELLAPSELAQLEAERPLWYVVCEPLGLMDVYRSGWFYAGVGLLLYNLVSDVIARIIGMPAALKPGGAPRRVAALQQLSSYERLEPADRDVLSRLATVARSAGFKVALDVERRSLAGVRHRHAVLASIFFHGSMILLVVGGAASATGRFSGVITLGVSESFDGAASSYVGGDPDDDAFRDVPDLQFTLKSLEVDFVGDDVLDARATLVDRDGIEHLVRVNEPFVEDDASVRLVDYGLAPALDIRGPFPGGRAGLRPKLLVMPPGKVDEVVLEATGVTFSVRIYPDFFAAEAGPASHTRDLLNPVAQVSYERYGEQTGALIPLGERARVGAYRVALKDIQYWGHFIVDRNAGKPWVFAGMLLGLLGLCWRFAWQRAWLYGVLEEADDGLVLHLAARHEYTQSGLRARFQRVVEALRSS